MKVAQVTNYFIYTDSAFPIKKEILSPIYVAVPDLVDIHSQIDYIKRDSLPWFQTDSTIQFYTENVRLSMIPLIGNTPEQVLELIEEYQQLVTTWLLERSYKL